MSRPLAVRRSIALTGAFVLATWGAAALPAQADPGNGNSGSHASHGKKDKDSEKESKSKKDKSHGDKNHGSKDHGPKDTSDKGDKGNGPKGKTDKGGKGEKSDPPGNNGTVKIAPYGPVDSIPNNTPHVDCHFQIEWYGFDEGDDIVSTVVFAMQAPTKDVVLSGTEPSEVFVGGDPATGAGTETGFDGVQDYTLGFDGEPHAQQGYHVKLTIHTPGSQGADTKHKVFWVQPCEDETGDTTDTEGDEESTEGSRGNDTEVLGEQASTNDTSASSDDTEVMGAQANAGNADQAPAAGVPSAVDAGEEGNPVVKFVTSPLPLLLLGLGLVVGGVAFATRRAGAKI